MIRIVVVGKNNPALKEYEAELLKVIGKFSKIEVVELKEDKSDTPAQIMVKEGERIIPKLSGGGVVCALEIAGKEMDSVSFSEFLKENRDVTFVIGGAWGLSDPVLGAADCSLSFSPMTFNHQLARVMLLEQVFRGLSIINGHKYHK